MFIALSFLWGLLSRYYGSDLPKPPKVILAMFMGIPLALLSYLTLHSLAISALTLACYVLGRLTGHGRGISLGEPMKPGSKPEKVEFLIRFLEPVLSTYWYKNLILFITGFISFATTGWALWGGLSKSIAYSTGWLLSKGSKATAMGEFLTGLVGFLPVFYYLLLLL